ncbi:MAG TPA: alkaline phosphatase family protein [Candidatus Dormibacteraeota bacterium]|nr:alkaline phosphatase family protein [Candidatus Dormibacteraeota bacterium]
MPVIDPPLPGIEHVVLLMFENRSFDNMLGAFYPAAETRGGVPNGWFNPYLRARLRAWQAPAGSDAQTIPYPDPQECFDHMASQIDGPFGPMMGFAADYGTVQGADPKAVMQYYQAANVPVTSALAMAYAASDRYFASGPVQTWPNRLFSLCGTPGRDPVTNMAYLNNEDYPDDDVILGQLPWPSIFEQLDNQGETWRVYYDDEEPIAALITYVFESMDNWSWFDTFFDDVSNGTLPTFSLIEPRYQMWSAWGRIAPNSNHPGSSTISPGGSPISVSCGEQMLAQVYRALVSNPELFATTLLIVTYDEHGGLFDHVSPPAAASPFDPPLPANFDYARYGVRVPNLFINPYVQQGLFPAPGATNVAFDHTSILATLRDQFGLTGSLSPRVAAATNFAGLIDPSRQPIVPPGIPVPECVWSPSPATEHAEPIVRTMLRRGSFLGPRPTRRTPVP